MKKINLVKHIVVQQGISAGQAYDEAIRNTLYSGTSTSKISSTDMLTLDDVKKAVKTLERLDKKEKSRIAKLTKDGSWQRSLSILHAMLSWLFNEDRLEDYKIVWLTIEAMQPNPLPINSQFLPRLNELWDEYFKIYGTKKA